MTRIGVNQLASDGTLLNGFDYEHQAWVTDGLYQDCGHPAAGEILASWPGLRGEGIRFKGCNCYGRAHAGERCTSQGGTL